MRNNLIQKVLVENAEKKKLSKAKAEQQKAIDDAKKVANKKIKANLKLKITGILGNKK